MLLLSVRLQARGFNTTFPLTYTGLLCEFLLKHRQRFPITGSTPSQQHKLFKSFTMKSAFLHTLGIVTLVVISLIYSQRVSLFLAAGEKSFVGLPASPTANCISSGPEENTSNSSRNSMRDLQPTVVILPGPHKTGSTTTQLCMADWSVEGKSYLHDWSWPVPSQEDREKLNVYSFYRRDKGFAALAIAQREYGKVDPRYNLTLVYETYRKTLNHSWKNGKNIVFGSEEFDRIIENKPWTNHLMDVILSMLPESAPRNNLPVGRPFNARRDVEVVLNYRTPRIGHLRSIWHEIEPDRPGKPGKSFKAFLLEHSPDDFKLVDTLGLALHFLRRDLKTTIVHLSGMKEEKRDLCHVIACDIMMANCTKSGFLDTVPQDHNNSNANARPDAAMGLNMTEHQMARMDKVISDYDCALWRELEVYAHTQQLQVLFRQHNFLDGCSMNNTKRSFEWVVDNIRRIALE